ncbi:MAG: hypothetical protein E3K32_08835 [wastewater metagenome]|nr:hypothetical protein [Candidatus Loosdrechtia aerotolerans]
MNFTPKQHLEIGNYVKYLDEILHKCEKGIEYCKICPNESVCAELEKDDFGLHGSSISDILEAIQYTLEKIPGYLHFHKREEFKSCIKRYINEAPVQKQGMWKESILDTLLDNKLADPTYKPPPKVGEIRTLLTYSSKISFSPYLKCIYRKNESTPYDTSTHLSCEVISQSTKVIRQFIQARNIEIAVPHTTDYIRYYIVGDISEMLQRCNVDEIGLAAALCYYALLTQIPITGNIVVTGKLDSRGRISPVDSLDNKIETVLRELHYINKIIVPKDTLPDTHYENVPIVEVDNLQQAIEIVFSD